MLTFLRKLRKSLIESDRPRRQGPSVGVPRRQGPSGGKKPASRASRYVFYALGEIALVVIGILIALQVNNWNNQRIDRKQATTYLQGIKNDTEDNLILLDRFINNATLYVAKHDSLASLRAQQLTPADLHYLGIRRQTYFLKDDTYREIIANGHLKMLPDSIKSILMDLNTLIKSVNKIDDQLANMINNQHLKMGEYFEMRRTKQFIGYDIIPVNHVDQDKALLVHKNYINICYDWMKLQVSFYGLLKRRQLMLLDLIKKHLGGSNYSTEG